MSRRGLLGALGAAGSLTLAACQANERAGSGASPTGPPTIGFHGEHQAGILTAPQRLLALTAFDLRAGATRDDLRRMFLLWTDTARRLSEGRPALADTEPELATSPANLTVTVGVGPRAVATSGAPAPGWLRPLPPFAIDRLQPRWNGGDIVLQLCADDDMALAHATRTLAKEAGPFATVRWQQRGWRTSPEGTENRNLFGQVDGTINPSGADAESLVWIQGDDAPDWLRGGTSMVVRRIAMNLATWDEVDRPGREATIGRDLATGTPLTGGAPGDAVDLDRTDPTTGLPVIAAAAHTRRAMTGIPGQRILRRPYNYDEDPFTVPGTPGRDGISSSGLVFITFQADVDAQFLPIQRRLAEADLLNTWVSPIGSAVFAILPGARDGEILGQALVDA